MEYDGNIDFVKGMNLTKTEIETFERFINLVEKAQKDRVGFFRGQEVAFTPGAMLVIAVAKFVYDVYQDYGRLVADPIEFQHHFKEIIRQLNEAESFTGDSASLDTYSRLRRDLNSVKKFGG